MWRPVLGSLLLLACGCAAVPGRGPWGESVSLPAGLGRLGDAIVDAATDPLTWIPAAGAAAVSLGDLDQDITRWANRHSPVFGSQKTADDVGGLLLGTSIGLWALTSAAAPGGDDTGQILENKAAGFAVGGAALLTTQFTTDSLKAFADRPRPSGRGSRSFPSGHASMSSAAATLSARNLEYYDLSPGSRGLLQGGLYGIAALTGWSRVEANDHHPSDVLAGIALGHFVSAVFHDAMFGPVEIEISPLPGETGVAVAFTFRF